EAVTINPVEETISVATIGKADVPQLTERIRTTIERVQVNSRNQCRLLEGDDACATCAQPLTDVERPKLTIHRDAGQVTIARVTCPTAPKFWRWREIPFPRVVQRDVEFLEHADEEEEWKAQLVAAALCGAFGLGAFLLRAHPWAVWGYVLAYLAGSWFT